jgi:predicted NACHT family NTPase
VLGPAGLRAGLRDSVLLAWRKGGALICLDGLDEVPGTLEATTQGRRSRRERIAEAIRRLDRQLDRSRLIVTCRTRPYEQDAAWQLRDDWALRRLQPFAFGQVRHFVRAWYAETCGSAQALYTPAEAEKRAQRLVEVLERREVLRELTTSPLLLTMLALLDYNKEGDAREAGGCVRGAGQAAAGSLGRGALERCGSAPAEHRRAPGVAAVERRGSAPRVAPARFRGPSAGG